MATKPEPNLEEQLKAYAELRRKEASPPLEMHPATRSLLHGEIVRTYGRSATEAMPRKNWFAAFWPRLVMGTAVCAALAWLLVSMPTERREEMASGRAGESATTPRLRVSASPRDAAPVAASSTPASDKLQIADLADSRSAPVAAGRNIVAPQPAAAVPEQSALVRQMERESVGASKRDADRSALSAERSMKEEVGRLAEFERRSGALPQSRSEPLALKPRESADAAGTSQLGMGLEKARTAASAVPPPAVAANSAPSPAKSAPRALAETDTVRRADQPIAGQAMGGAKESKAETAALAMNEQRASSETLVRKKTPGGAGQAVAFSSTTDFQSAAGAKAKVAQRFQQFDAGYRQNFNSPPPSKVLTSFQIEQTGQQVRITDADGSTYLGELMVAERRNDESANRRTGEPAKERVSDLADSPSRSLAGSQYILPAGQTFNFRAVGTNRSLNQAVVFDGSFLNYGNAALGGVTAPASNATWNYQQLPLNQLRIQGRAVIGGNSEIPIDAVPTKP